MTRPAMKNLGPAYARIAKIEAHQSALFDKREAEFLRIRNEGSRVARAAIKKAGLIRGETVVQIGRWDRGIYDGSSLNWPPSGLAKQWSFLVLYRSIRKNGRPGKGIHRAAVFVEHPGDVTNNIQIIGRVVGRKVVLA